MTISGVRGGGNLANGAATVTVVDKRRFTLNGKNGAAVAAFLRDNGIVHIDHYETLLEAAPLFKNVRPPVGRRVSVLTTTGGGAALVMVNLGLRGIDAVPPGTGVVSRSRHASRRIGL